jgi:hypothetical protein
MAFRFRVDTRKILRESSYLYLLSTRSDILILDSERLWTAMWFVKPAIHAWFGVFKRIW